MGEWALPADESLVFTEVLHRAQDERRPEARWLRGAFWRNFQVKYREINDLHKQMLRGLGRGRRDAAPAPTRDRALDHLYQGQSNDCYWHGLFGGIYISHMRLATYEHLIAAEDLAETGGAARSSPPSCATSTWTASTRSAWPAPGQVVTVDLDGGAGIGGWDIRAVRHALASVMRRRPEAYHDDRSAARSAEAAAAQGGDGGAPTSIHDIVPGQGARPRRASRVRRLRAAQRTSSGSWPRRHARGLGDGRGRPSSATPSTARSRSSTSARTGSGHAARGGHRRGAA